MRAIVTGSTGFVGSHLVEDLLLQGFDVTCLLRPSSRPGWVKDLPVNFRTASLHNPDELADVLQGTDYVFHVAGLTRARSKEEYQHANTETTRRLLRTIRDTNIRLKRFVYVSSLAAAGPTRGTEPLDEAAEARPIEEYGASKLAAEHFVLHQADRVPVTVVRPPVVYGRRDRNVLVLFRTAQRFRVLPAIGSVQNRLSMVHVSDLVRGIRLAAVTPAGAGQVYFMAGGNYRMAEIAEGLGTALRVNVRPFRIPPGVARLIGEWGELVWSVTRRPQLVSRRKIQHALQPRWTCTWAKARRELGYTATVHLVDGLVRTAEWYAEQGWIRRLP